MSASAGVERDSGDTREQRRHYRIALALPLDRFAFSANESDAWDEANATLRDLSVGGAAVETDTAVKVGARVRFRFPMPLEGTELDVQGTVILSEAAGQGRHVSHRLGIRFEDLSLADRNWLTRQLHHLQTARRR